MTENQLPTARPIPTREDRLHDARQATSPAYLTADERDQLHARASMAEQELAEARAELAAEQAKVERRRVELRDAGNDLLDIRGILSPNGYPRRVPMDLVPTVAPAVQWLVDELARAQTELDVANAQLADLRALYTDHADGPPISGHWLMGQLRKLTDGAPAAVPGSSSRAQEPDATTPAHSLVDHVARVVAVADAMQTWMKREHRYLDSLMFRADYEEVAAVALAAVQPPAADTPTPARAQEPNVVDPERVLNALEASGWRRLPDGSVTTAAAVQPPAAPEPRAQEPDEEQYDVEVLLANVRRSLASARDDSERAEAVEMLLCGWYAAWPDSAVTDPHRPLAGELVRLLAAVEPRAQGPDGERPGILEVVRQALADEDGWHWGYDHGFAAAGDRETDAFAAAVVAALQSAGWLAAVEPPAADTPAPAEAAERSSVIAVPSRFTQAIRGRKADDGRDWVRLRTGSGREYEGYRSATCPGDNRPGHQHDIRCVAKPAPAAADR